MMKFVDNHSQGCKACQEGKWLCIFLTYLCDASCGFCPAPMHKGDTVNSAFGDDPGIILEYLDRYPFKGVSFSGGECFMVYDRMLDWLKQFKAHKPDLYYWAYTNGINVEREQMEKLKEAGLNELRFNTAASGYDDKKVLETIANATEFFEHVAVEIPSIPEDLKRLKTVLPILDQLGVNYLNLHEYILVPNDPNTQTAPKGQFLMNHEMRMLYHRESLANTDEIKAFCQANNLKIRINNCSLQKKDHQMLGRRLTMGTLLKEDHERLGADGFLETVYIPTEDDVNLMDSLKRYHQMDRTRFIHPDRAEGAEPESYLLRILPRLGIDALPKVLDFTKIH
jgi:pyruvate formate-lyase activating enzyme-like uncharacterized protein